MTRLSRIARCLLLSAPCLLPVFAATPNIIFIMADDLGWADLGCYGQKVIQTPCLDRMAKEGTLFTQCYAGSTVCAPSRSVLMTGRHTGHTTVRGKDRKSVVEGKSVDLGGRRLIKKKTKTKKNLCAHLRPH